jgi:hypothetical protein
MITGVAVTIRTRIYHDCYDFLEDYMGVELTKDVVDLLDDDKTNTVLATLDEHGFPHVECGAFLQAGERGNLFYLETVEFSETNRNLTRSIWFDNRVAIALSNSSGQAFQIKGKPVKVHITGPLFSKYYQRLQQENGNVNLAAVWEIEPDEIINEGLALRQKHEEMFHPFFTHLDRIAR